MAKARIDTLLALDQFAELLNINPLHFNQVTCAAFPETRDCQSVWYQQGHQTGRGVASRELLANTIARAEATLASHMGFWPAPKQVREEIRPSPHERYPTGQRRDSWAVLGLRWSRFLDGGVYAYQELFPEVAVTYEDSDGDGYAEEAVITFAFDGDWRDIAIFPSADVLGTRRPVDRIRNLDGVSEAGQVTLRGSRGYFVRPQLWSGPRNHFINGDDDANFLEQVSIYQRYIASDEDHPPVEFGWQTTQQTTAFAVRYGVLQTYLPREGMVSLVPTVWDEDTGAWEVRACGGLHPPQLVKTNYIAGEPLDEAGRVTAPFDRAIVALAAATIGTNICVCSPMQALVAEWQRTPVRNDGPAGSVIVRNPFGPYFGAYEAFQIANRERGFGVTSL